MTVGEEKGGVSNGAPLRFVANWRHSSTGQTHPRTRTQKALPAAPTGHTWSFGLAQGVMILVPDRLAGRLVKGCHAVRGKGEMGMLAWGGRVRPWPPQLFPLMHKGGASNSAPFGSIVDMQAVATFSRECLLSYWKAQ